MGPRAPGSAQPPELAVPQRPSQACWDPGRLLLQDHLAPAHPAPQLLHCLATGPILSDALILERGGEDAHPVLSAHAGHSVALLIPDPPYHMPCPRHRSAPRVQPKSMALVFGTTSLLPLATTLLCPTQPRGVPVSHPAIPLWVPQQWADPV